MSFYGLHIADWLVIILYFAMMLWIGRATAPSVHGSSDFFLAGRKLGGWLQFFLNFGQMSDAAGAGRTSSVVYSQGVGGVWFNLQTLFMTPYYWFMNPWFRRARLTTVADLFEDRFGGRFLAMLYAGCTVFLLTIGLGYSYLVAFKMTEFMIVKPEAAYSVSERASVRDFQEFRKLDDSYRHGHLEPRDTPRYEYLKKLRDRDEIRSSISYLSPLAVYIAFTVIVATYVILGGMTAAAITDAIQGVLIVVFSVMLIPYGLRQVGGLAAFHERLPDRLLDLFGSGGGTDFAWYSVFSILLVTIVQIHAVPGNMAVAGSARDETAAAIGAIGGGFLKRWMIIAWCFCGLIAYAMFGGGTLSDPDAVWGALCRTLLGPGLLGLMLVGILAADMSSVSSHCLSLSALFVRNIYLVLFPHKTEREGLILSRLVILFALLAGVGIALMMRDIISFMKIGLTLNVPFGAAILVIFKWRRVTRSAVIVSVIASLLVIVVIPLAVPLVPGLNAHPALQSMTAERRESHRGKATPDDVSAGRARTIGEAIDRVNVIAPRPIFFEKCLATDPGDPRSPTRGQGRFHLELYLLSVAGLPVHNMVPAQLLASYYIFDSLFPFLLLFGISLVTRDGDPEKARRFYAKMRTRVVADPEQDAANLALNCASSGQSESIKIFPGSSWEFYRWRKADFIAFAGCCLLAIVILAAFAAMLRWGRG